MLQLRSMKDVWNRHHCKDKSMLQLKGKKCLEQKPEQREQYAAAKKQGCLQHTQQHTQHHHVQCMTRYEYLYVDGWKTESLDEQTYANKATTQFQQIQNKWQRRQCTVGKEQWPAQTQRNVTPYLCIGCQRDKRVTSQHCILPCMSPFSLHSYLYIYFFKLISFPL